jgi:hypothetical protein
MQECEYLSTCPVFARFKLEGLKNIWISLYCKGPKNSECERLKLKKMGKDVPDTLLPNGKHIEL